MPRAAVDHRHQRLYRHSGEVEHEGELRSFSADLVVVSCGAANSARLLLMSANDQHPRGLANSSDQVDVITCITIAKWSWLLPRAKSYGFSEDSAINDWYFVIRF